MNKLIAFLTLLLLSATLCQAQDVFADAYNHDVFGNNIIFTGNNGHLLVGGEKHYFGPSTSAHPNHSDFGLVRTKADGTPLLTKYYHFLPNDKVEYVSNIDSGYVMGGVSRYRKAADGNASIVIARTDLRGNVKWSKAFFPRNGKGINIAGLVVTPNGDIVFTAHVVRARSTTNTRYFQGLIVRLDGRGNVKWSRLVNLGTAFGLDRVPRSNVAINNTGAILTGWQFGDAQHRGRRGISFRAYTPQGRLLYNKSYRANGLLSMTFTPADNGLAAYALDTMNHSGLIKLNNRGEFQYGYLDNLQNPNSVATHSSIKEDNGRIPYSFNNQLTLGKAPLSTTNSLVLPAVKVDAPARMRDFVTDGRDVYITATIYHRPSRRSFPVLLKSAFANIDNCFTQHSQTKVRARFPIRKFRADLTPDAQQLINVLDSAITLRTRTFAALDSVACVGGGEVWPGDANSDGFAETKDLLAIGMAWGRSGPARPNANNNWVGQPARNWGPKFINDADYKHTDCNGNGHVGMADVLVLLSNFGMTHSKSMVNGSPSDAPLSVEIPVEGLTAGKVVEIPVRLGSDVKPVGNIHGLNFSILYDAASFGETVTFQPATSWLGTPGQDLVSIEKNAYDEGKIDIAITRIDQQDVAGNGIIGYLVVTPAAGVKGASQPVFLEVNNTYAVNTGLEEFLLYGNQETSAIHTPADALTMPMRPADLGRQEMVEVFPNPASDVLNIRTDGEAITSVVVTDLFGRVVMVQDVNGTDLRLNLSELPEGMYLLKAKTETGLLAKRFRVQ